MPLLLVSYDTNSPERDHSDLLMQIEKYSHVRLSKFSYAIITDHTPTIVCEKLKKHVDKNDNLFIITLKLPYKAYGSNLANDWLNKTLMY
jgi:hypothetical protein